MNNNFIEAASIAALQSLLPLYDDLDIAVNRSLEVANILKDKLSSDNKSRKDFFVERGDEFFFPVLGKKGFTISSDTWQYRQNQLLLRSLNFCFNTDEECAEAVDKLNAAFIFI